MGVSAADESVVKGNKVFDAREKSWNDSWLVSYTNTYFRALSGVYEKSYYAQVTVLKDSGASSGQAVFQVALPSMKANHRYYFKFLERGSVSNLIMDVSYYVNGTEISSGRYTQKAERILFFEVAEDIDDVVIKCVLMCSGTTSLTSLYYQTFLVLEVYEYDLENEWKDEQRGFWQWLKDFLNTLKDAILNLPQMIIDGIKNLFVPSADYLESWKDEISQSLNDSLGILYQVPQIVVNIFTAINDASVSDTYRLTFPEINLGFMGKADTILIPETHFSFNDVLDGNSALKSIYDIYLAFVDFLIVIALCMLAWRKYNKIMGG